MKNLYNTIEQSLKVGLHVVVKDLEDNQHCVISPFKDEDENYRDSCWSDTIGDAKLNIGAYNGDTIEEWNNFDLEIVEVFRLEYKPFKVGDKVRILDSIKETENWEEAEDDFEDMTGEIREVFLERMGTNYSVNGWFIGHEHLAPLIETKEIEEMTMDQICKELGREVKIKK